MAQEQNLLTSGALGEVLSIDFVSRFEADLIKFAQALGIATRLPMHVGGVIRQYRTDATLHSGEVAEGDVIPLSQVEKTELDPIRLLYKKHRKSTSIEAVQEHGYTEAVGASDAALYKALRREIRQEFFNFIAGAATDDRRADGGVPLTAPTLQAAIARASAHLHKVVDDDVTAVVLANPDDVADHLAAGNIASSGAVFGGTLLNDYLGARILVNRDVPKGTVYATAAENLVLAFASPRGEVGKGFDFVTDETGFIGVLHAEQHDRLVVDTVTWSAVTLFPDLIDAVVAVKIENA